MHTGADVEGEMSEEVDSLTRAVELVAAGGWAVDTALRCLENDDVERARSVLEDAGRTMRDGLQGLRDVLEASVRDAYERPERLAAALESLQELRDLSPPRE